MRDLSIAILLSMSIPLSLASDLELIGKENRHFKEYTVQENDTLMIIASKIYGDYREWKALAKINPDLMAPRYDLTHVKRIKFEPPTKLFVWEPLGEPYIVQEGDSLANISKKLYGTPKRWDELFQNNRPLLRFPHLIFTGFTLYYIPDPAKD